MPHRKRLVLHRLISYYRLLSEWTAKKPVQTVTSAQIGDALDIDPTQVRKDLSAIGAAGMGRVGFEVCEVCRAIRTALGFDRTYQAVLVGAGHMVYGEVDEGAEAFRQIAQNSPRHPHHPG